jgi:hypothetical protein
MYSLLIDCASSADEAKSGLTGSGTKRYYCTSGNFKVPTVRIFGSCAARLRNTATEAMTLTAVHLAQPLNTVTVCDVSFSRRRV